MEEEPIEEPSVNKLLAFYIQKGKIGICYISLDEGEMQWGETLFSEEIIDQIKLDIQPHIIITSSSVFSNYLSHMKQSIDKEGKEFEVRLLKNVDFSFEAANQRLFKLHCAMTGKDAFDTSYQKNRIDTAYMYGLSKVNCHENPLMVGAAGALLKFIIENRLELAELDETAILNSIKTVVHLDLGSFVRLDSNTYQALHIFRTELHPCYFAKIGVAKEGLSLFSILNKTTSTIGKELLRKWFLQPLSDISKITVRLDLVEYFSQLGRRDLVNQLSERISKVKNTKAIVNRISESKASIHDWFNLVKSIQSFTDICNACFQEEEEKQKLLSFELFQKMKKVMDGSLHELSFILNKVINFSDSKTENRLVVNCGVNSDLDQKKEIFNNLENFLSSVSEEQIKLFPENFPFTINIFFFPQFGYLLAIPNQEMEEYTFDLEDLHFSLQFKTDEMHYFKNETMLELDESLGDIFNEILDAERSILTQVEKYVLEEFTSISSIAEIIAELDCILSFAKVSKEYGYVRPVLTNSSMLKIVNGRNPIQELNVDTFIPNDISVNENDSRVSIITGPNNSGKSVYLRQVGLLAFMAHIGCFVAADSAVIGILDRIMTRIVSEDTVSVSQSTFAVDLMQVNNMLLHATNKSLLLLDEFAKGTLALDGVSLLASVLNHFVEKKDKSPMVFVSTHYTEVFELKLVPIQNPYIQYWTMDAITNMVNTVSNTQVEFQPMNNSNSEETVGSSSSMQNSNIEKQELNLICLYKLTKGKSLPSYGQIIAKTAGIPEEVVKRAEAVQQKMNKNEPIFRIEMDDKNNQYHDKCQQIVKQFFGVDFHSISSATAFVEWLKTLH